MANARVKKWEEFQHYKDRSPPWLKLHRSLLDDYAFQMLPIASKALAPMVWLLASDSKDGSFCIDIDFLCFRLRWPEKDIKDGLKPLIEKGFIEVDSESLAECLQGACLETEGERETEKRKEAKPVKPAVSLIPEVPEKLMRDFLAIRKAKKQPLTETAVDGIRREAGKAGIPIEQAIKVCCENSWAGFKASWDWEGKGRMNSNGSAQAATHIPAGGGRREL